MKDVKDVFEVIRERDFEGLKEFLVEYPRGLDVETSDGVWALHEVMRQGDLEMAKYVVEYAIVNLNLVDKRGNTVLHYGVDSGNLELVKYLVERVNLCITQANLEGETSLDRAIALGQGEIKAYFEKVLGCTMDELYRNPICRGMHPDPSIVRVGEDYYMVNSSFMFFPCIPISHSRDLIHWEVIGHAITRPDWARLKGLEGGRGYWAPDISYDRGRFYITATYRLNEGGMPQRLQMVTSADRPEGQYCEPVFLDEDGIDPSIFTDLDGRRYMLLNRGARIFEISADGREILSKPRLLWYGDNKKASEGPHMLYKDGYYYLFMAEGGTGRGHRISVARSKSLMGIYEPCPYNPILRQWDEKKLLQCCGHGMPVDTPAGDWYMVYLCNRIGVAGCGILGRETALDPITWTADGWPVVNSLRGPSDLQRKPDVGDKRQQSNSHIDCDDQSSEARRSAFAPEQGIWGEWFTVRGTEPGVYEISQETISTANQGENPGINQGANSEENREVNQGANPEENREVNQGANSEENQGVNQGANPEANRRTNGEEILIHGNGRDLNTLDYSAVLLQSQREFCFEVSCKIKVQGPVSDEVSLKEKASVLKENWDMGLTCYYDENSYLKFGVGAKEGKTGILTAEYVDDHYVTEEFLPLDDTWKSEETEVELRIVTKHLERSCCYRLPGQDWKQAAICKNTRYLSSEGLKK